MEHQGLKIALEYSRNAGVVSDVLQQLDGAQSPTHECFFFKGGVIERTIGERSIFHLLVYSLNVYNPRDELLLNLPRNRDFLICRSGLLTWIWMRSDTTETQIGTHMECWHC